MIVLILPLFDLSKEIGIVEKVDAQSSLEAFIPLIKHQAKLALYIVERSKDKHLNTHYYYEPFQKNKTLNWCTRLLCALTWLEKSFVSTKQIVFGLETVSRFFFPKTISLCPLPNVRKTHKIKKRLRGNILFAKKILAALSSKKKEEIDEVRNENASIYITVFGTQCLNNPHSDTPRPIDSGLFTIISAHNGHKDSRDQIDRCIRRKYDLYNTVTLNKTENERVKKIVT
jgi:hypothetical protein